MYWQRLSAAKAAMQSMQGQVPLKPRQRQSPLNGPHCELMQAKAKTYAKALVPLPPATPPLPQAPPPPPIATIPTSCRTYVKHTHTADRQTILKACPPPSAPLDPLQVVNYCVGIKYLCDRGQLWTTPSEDYL